MPTGKGWAPVEAARGTQQDRSQRCSHSFTNALQAWPHSSYAQTTCIALFLLATRFKGEVGLQVVAKDLLCHLHRWLLNAPGLASSSRPLTGEVPMLQGCTTYMCMHVSAHPAPNCWTSTPSTLACAPTRLRSGDQARLIPIHMHPALSLEFSLASEGLGLVSFTI